MTDFKTKQSEQNDKGNWNIERITPDMVRLTHSSGTFIDVNHDDLFELKKFINNIYK